MKKTLASVLLIGALSFSSAPAFATSPSPEPILKGFASTQTPTDHAEPGHLPYPAAPVTPNTVNGVVPASSQPTPAPTTVAAPTPATLPNTGVTGLMYVWGGVGLLAAVVGLAFVIRAKRRANA